MNDSNSSLQTTRNSSSSSKAPTTTPQNWIVIGDSHAKPGVSNYRYERLGRFIASIQPHVVVDIGDFADLPSLSSYDKGTKGFEGKRLLEDIEVARDARRLVTQPFIDLQKKCREQHHKIPQCEFIHIEGNHEYRLTKLMDSQPELHGVWPRDFSGAIDLGWSFHPYLTYTTINGVSLIHHQHNKMGKPLHSGVYPAMSNLNHAGTSIIVGHSHEWSWAEKVTPSGEKRFGLVAGCYFNHFEQYAKTSNKDWVRCITYLEGVQDGAVRSIHKIAMEDI